MIAGWSQRKQRSFRITLPEFHKIRAVEDGDVLVQCHRAPYKIMSAGPVEVFEQQDLQPRKESLHCLSMCRASYIHHLEIWLIEFILTNIGVKLI